MKKTGFTIVEVLIVVAIISILIAIGVPGFLSIRKRVHINSELSNLKMIETSAALYDVHEYGGWDAGNNMSAYEQNINYLWPANSNVSDPSSYIRKKLFCPFPGDYHYGYDANRNKAICSEHGYVDDVLEL